MNLEDYTEYTSALRRAFVDNKADYVSITSRHQQFLIRSAELGMDQGWLELEILGSDEEQWTEFRYRLTDIGRAFFGL